MATREITVRMHHQDTVDWLGDTDLAARYEQEVARRLAAELQADVTIEDGYVVGGSSGVSYDSACDYLDGRSEAEVAYEAICDDLCNDWTWAGL